MKERGMIFNTEMVRAILDGRKTQTRRVVLHQPQRSDILPNLVFPRNKQESNYPPGGWIYPNGMEQILSLCPFGSVGDRLWVRETFATLGNEDGCPIDWNDKLVKCGGPEAARIYRASCDQKPGDYGLWSIPDDAFWKPHTDDMKYEGSWTPSIHMPRWASRITLEITSVRVERLQDIKEEDAKSEGLAEITKDRSLFKFGIPDRDGYPGTDDNGWPWHEWERNPVDAYCKLWQSIYGEESWNANPWVWVIEFREVK